MSYLTISQASKILEVNKKTLFRWDKAGKFKPASRERVSKIRLYNEKDVRNLKVVLDHENRFQKNLKEFRNTQRELSQNMTVFLLSDKEIELQEKAEEFYNIHKKLVEEFIAYPEEIKSIHRRFYKI